MHVKGGRNGRLPAVQSDSQLLSHESFQQFAQQLLRQGSLG